MSPKKATIKRSIKPYLFLFCGLPAVGKTYHAKKIARKYKAVHLMTDKIRKELFPHPSYSKEESKKVYKEMLKRAIRFLKDKRNVVLDGTYLNTKRRKEVYQSVQKLKVHFKVFYITASPHTVLQRLQKRKKKKGEYSDADFHIYKMMREKLRNEKEMSSPLGDKKIKIKIINND